jgi:hypothetical protein
MNETELIFLREKMRDCVAGIVGGTYEAGGTEFGCRIDGPGLAAMLRATHERRVLATGAPMAAEEQVNQQNQCFAM